jgi:hypothetical protein
MEVLIYLRNFQIQYMPISKITSTILLVDKAKNKSPAPWVMIWCTIILRWKRFAKPWKLGSTDYHLWKATWEFIKWSKVKHWLCMRWWWLRCLFHLMKPNTLQIINAIGSFVLRPKPCLFYTRCGSQCSCFISRNDSAAVLQFIKDGLAFAKMGSTFVTNWKWFKKIELIIIIFTNHLLQALT